ncbi:alpha/beta hydrolase [Candidatus Woesebacteria bacterium]|nr:alpha/beta hydrolase [Candidatus Woesebacteria bacterium]
MVTLILHGWRHSAQMWAPLVSQLGTHASAIDLPGFGSQKLVSDSWGVPEYADWVISQISDREDIILLGHSFGGRIAAEIASKQPAWLKAIILSGAPCLYNPSIKTQFEIKIAKIGKKLIPSSYQDRFLSSDLLDARKAGLENIFRKVVGYDQTEQLKKISVPTLLVWGEHDTEATVDTAKRMQSLIKDSKLRVIEGSGHNAFLENPQLFYGYINDFITTL